MPAFKIAIVPVTPFAQNCSLIWEPETGEAAVVDPGGDVERILQAVSSAGAEVSQILLTHGHLDHAGGAAALKRALDDVRQARGAAPVPILGPDRRDQFLLDGIAESQRSLGLSGMENVRPDRWLREGDEVTVGGLRFAVLHCPGHTPGHIVFAEISQRFAFVGDTVFQRSVGRSDFPYGDGAALVACIKSKLLPLGDDMTFIPGHGPATTAGAERLENPFLQG